MTPRFDPTSAIVYDLARGQLRDDEGAERLNLPAHLLLRLCEQAGPQASQDFGRTVGEDLGRRIADRMGESTANADVAAWTEHLGGHLALLGLGNMTVEQWGRALVIGLSGAPKGTEQIVSSVIEGAMQRGLGRSVNLVSFTSETNTQFLVLSPDSAAKAKQMVESGSGLGQIVEQLHRGAA